MQQYEKGQKVAPLDPATDSVASNIAGMGVMEKAGGQGGEETFYRRETFG
jgi:hypothetical protein